MGDSKPARSRRALLPGNTLSNQMTPIHGLTAVAEVSTGSKLMRLGRRLFVLTTLLLWSASVGATDHEKSARAYLDSGSLNWVHEPLIVEAIKAVNVRNASLATADIDRLDKQWRAEIDAAQRPLIDRLVSNELSSHLAGIKARSDGLITEIIVMDSRGLNVAQSDVTSDYWQGDEAKWKYTYHAGAGVVFIDDVEFDESTQLFQCQISLSITDPQSDIVIGVVTVGVNVELLSYFGG